MLLQIVNSIGFVVPPEKSSRVEVGNLYVRRTSHGGEFVRKKEQRCGKMDSLRRSKPQRRCSKLGRQELLIAKKKQELEAELAAIERARARAQAIAEVEFRERQSCHRSSRSPETEEPRRPQTSRRVHPGRRRSIELDLQYTDYPNHFHRPRRPSYHNIHADVAYHSSESSRREQHLRKVSPKAPKLGYGRHSSWERLRPQKRHEEVPLVFEQIVEINGRRRKNVAENYYRRRSRHYHSEEDYDLEMRVPEDYCMEEY